MNRCPEESAALKEIAAAKYGDRNKTIIASVARLCGLPYSRAYEIWYSRARKIGDAERALIINARDKKRREAVRSDIHDIKTRLALLEARLRQTDSEFHSADIDALGEVIRGNR